MPTRDEIEKEIKQNFEVFSKTAFNIKNKGKFVLLRNGKVIEIMDTRIDAHKMGNQLYEDKVFSVQEISPAEVDLGYMSYALRPN